MYAGQNSTLRFSAGGEATEEASDFLGQDDSKKAAAPAAKEILIIEDSPTVRLYLKKIMEFAFPGAKIHEADDGRAALQTLTRGSVQLIISDLNMPRMDGRLFVQTLRKNSVLRRKPVLLLSGAKPDAAELDEDPLVRFLLKPSDPETIVKAAKELLVAASLQR
jgi:two-component system chemotaxis response regulator CheY